MKKNLDHPSINVPEVETILLAFQFWAPIWHRYRIVVHTDSSTAISSMQDSTLRWPANAALRETLLLAVRWNIVIEPQWVEGKRNGLADALSRFDDDSLTSISLSWQNPFSSMTRPPPAYLPHPVPRTSNALHGMELLLTHEKATTRP